MSKASKVDEYVEEQSQEIPMGEWSTGVLNCSSFCTSNCCINCFFPCVAVGQIAKRVDIAPTCLCGTAAAYFTWFVTAHAACPLLVCLLRGEVRKRFDIEGNCLQDCCCSLICTPCTVAQMATHTRSATREYCGFGEPETYTGQMIRN